MARQIIDTGTLALNGKDGDTNRDAADKCNANFAELYNQNENFVRGAGIVQGGELVVFAGTTGKQVAADPRGAPGSAAFKNSTEFATAAQGTKADNAQVRLVAGEGINIDNSDPAAPVISAEGGSGGGTVQTVAGVEPIGADIPAAELATALGVDNKLDADEAAASAVKLQTARTINGVSFDGTANITVEDDTKEPAIAAGAAGQYWNGSKAWADFAASVRSAVLQGLDLGTATAVLATDSVLSGIGKLQAQISARARSGVNNDITRLTAIDATGYGILRDGIPVFTGATSGAAGVRGLVPAPVALGSNPKFLADDGKWKEVAAGGGGLAVGTMYAWKFSRATIPGGSLPHDGQIVTNGRTLYPDLWALIQPFCVTDAVWLAAPYTSRGMFSSGNGTTDFRMPDDNAKYSDGLTISAMTLRGDGKNSAGTPGLHQADQLQNITGTFTGATNATRFSPATLTGAFQGTGNANADSGNAALTNQVSQLSFDASRVVRAGNETRGANSTVIWCTTVAKTGANTGTVDVTVLSNTVGQQGTAIADIQSKQVFTKFYQSPNTAWTAGGLLEFTHNLGQPKMVQLYGILTVATANFPIGTIFSLNVFVNTNYWGGMIVGESPVYVRARMATAMAIIFAAGSGDTATPANSQIFVRVAA